jgi:hypothetical protein
MKTACFAIVANDLDILKSFVGQRFVRSVAKLDTTPISVGTVEIARSTVTKQSIVFSASDVFNMDTALIVAEHGFVRIVRELVTPKNIAAI